MIGGLHQIINGTLAVAAVVLFGTAAGWALIAIADAMDRARERGVWGEYDGDWPNVPREMKVGGPAKRSRKAGGGAGSADRAAEDTQTIAHASPISHLGTGAS